MAVRLRVRELAEQRRFNISSLSRKSDVSQNTMRRLWHDPYRQVELSVLERIAKALDVPIGDLLEIVPDTPPTEAE
jgi:DNA-binding Xre family transcriptional regulator